MRVNDSEILLWFDFFSSLYPSIPFHGKRERSIPFPTLEERAVASVSIIAYVFFILGENILLSDLSAKKTIGVVTWRKWMGFSTPCSLVSATTTT